jgi:uncharacterized membrane protein YoaK (UPF0700 family)
MEKFRIPDDFGRMTKGRYLMLILMLIIFIGAVTGTLFHMILGLMLLAVLVAIVFCFYMLWEEAGKY